MDPVQSTNSPYDIVANCICTMLVSSIRRFYLITKLLTYHPLFEETLEEAREERDLHDSLSPPRSGRAIKEFIEVSVER